MLDTSDFLKWPNIGYINESVDLANVKFLCEAHDNEIMYVLSSHWKNLWQIDQFSCGEVRSVGNFKIHNKEKPINVEFTYYKINGHVVAFYFPCSQLIDWELVENAIKHWCPNRKYMTNATNFHNILIEMKELDARIKK